MEHFDAPTGESRGPPVVFLGSWVTEEGGTMTLNHKVTCAGITSPMQKPLTDAVQRFFDHKTYNELETWVKSNYTQEGFGPKNEARRMTLANLLRETGALSTVYVHPVVDEEEYGIRLRLGNSSYNLVP